MKALFLPALLCVFTLATANAQEDLWHQSTISGSWGGARTDLSNAGIEVNALYRSDNAGNVSGGLARQGGYIHNIDATIAVDGGSAFGWTGGSFFIHGLSNNGGKISPYVGDCQMVSNIEAANTTKIFQLWIQQEFLEKSLSLRAGLYDLNSEFYATQTSALFLNASHGIGKEVAQTGKNGPSIFPNTSLGLRVKLLAAADFYFQAVALDGVPGDADDPVKTSFHIDRDEGAFLNAEAGWSIAGDENVSLTKIAVGAWSYTSSFDPYLGSSGASAIGRNNGLYLLAEGKFLRFADASSRGLAAFVRVGVANGTINRFLFHLGVGAVATGMFDARPDDQFGIAVAHAHNGTDYLEYMKAQGTSVRHSEVSLETTYRLQLTPWLALQPDFQWVINPNTEPGRENATVVGVRTEVRI